MSFCRMTNDCDLLCYENGDGEVDIIVRASVESPNYSIPEGLDDLKAMEYMIRHHDKLYVKWDNPRCAQKYWNLTPILASSLLKNLRADGVRFPDSVFDDVAALEAEYALYEPTIGDMTEAQPL